MEAELEGRDGSETPAPAARRPEQLGFFLPAHRAHRAVRRDDPERADAVAAQAERPHHETEAATERETGDPAGRDLPARCGQSAQLGIAVELTPGHARLGPRGAGGGIDVHALHVRQVDHQSVVAHPAARHLVPATADADRGTVLARGPYRLDHVRRTGALGDERGAAVDQPVPHGPASS